MCHIRPLQTLLVQNISLYWQTELVRTAQRQLEQLFVRFMNQLSYNIHTINCSPVLIKNLAPNIYHYSHRIEAACASSQKHNKCTHHNVIKLTAGLDQSVKKVQPRPPHICCFRIIFFIEFGVFNVQISWRYHLQLVVITNVSLRHEGMQGKQRYCFT